MKLFVINIFMFGLSLLSAKAGFSDSINTQIETFLECGRSRNQVGSCSSKFLADSLMKEERAKIVIWLLRTHGKRQVENCNEVQTKVIQAAGYADRPYICLKHKSGDSEWGFLTYENKAGGLLITRVKDR
jgi:hypothetical protein